MSRIPSLRAAVIVLAVPVLILLLPAQVTAEPCPTLPDRDGDGEGDACDLDDGFLFVYPDQSGGVDWQRDIVYDSFNLYIGDLQVLRETGVYTQAPGSGPLAGRHCDMGFNASVFATPTPAPGGIAYFLMSGTRGYIEGSLDTDSAGNERPNHNACPHPRPGIIINGNGGFTAANGVTGGSGTAEDPYLIDGWTIRPDYGIPAVGISNTTAHFVLRNLAIGCGSANGIVLDNVADGRVEDSAITCPSLSILVRSGRRIALDRNVMKSYAAGIQVEQSDDIAITGNRVSDGGAGIILVGTTGAVVSGNSLLFNDRFGDGPPQATDDGGGNAWDAGHPAGGNYWTDYVGEDRCRGAAQDDCTAPDGLGDTPYLIDADSLDRYPLIRLPGSEGDLTPPEVSIAGPPGGIEWSGATIEVTGTAADAGSGLRQVQVRVNGGAWDVAAGPGAWSAVVPLSPGFNLIEARAIDHANNASAVDRTGVTLLVQRLAVTVEPTADVVNPGETVNFNVTIANRTDETITLDFPSGCQAFFRVESMNGAVLYDYVHHIGCPAVFTRLVLPPGGSRSYLFSWEQDTDAGPPVPVPGDYVIRGYFDTEGTPTGLATVSVVAPDRFGLTVRTDKTDYAADETVLMTVTLTNRTAGSITLSFPTGCQAFFRVETLSGAAVYDEFRHAICPDVLTSITLAPGGSRAFPLAWTQVDDGGGHVPRPGEYVIEGYMDSFEPSPTGTTRLAIR